MARNFINSSRPAATPGSAHPGGRALPSGPCTDIGDFREVLSCA